MEYFRREIVNDIVIEKINVSKITFIEAKVFWERLQKDIYSGYVYIIIDLSSCSTIDSTFTDIIFNTSRIISQRKGKINIVLPSMNTNELYKINSLSNYVGITNSIETAISQISMKDSGNLTVDARKYRN